MFDWRNADEGASQRTAMLTRSLEAVCITVNKCVRAPGCAGSDFERPSRSGQGRGLIGGRAGTRRGDRVIMTSHCGRTALVGCSEEERSPARFHWAVVWTTGTTQKRVRRPDDDKSSVLLPYSRLSEVEQSCGEYFTDFAKSRAAKIGFMRSQNGHNVRPHSDCWIRDQLLHVRPLTGWMCARTASNRHDRLQTENPWPYAKGVSGDAALHHSEDESRANSCANSCDRTLSAITTSADQQSRQPASPHVISDFISGQGEKKSNSHIQDEGR